MSPALPLLALLKICGPYQLQSDLKDKGLLDELQKLYDHIDWERVAIQTEDHGLSPLLYHWSQTHQINLSSRPKRTLQGLYVRHRQASEVRTQVLSQIFSAFAQAGIQPLLIKGAALAHLLYPEPTLRPMRDIDILVPESEAIAAQQILGKIGFTAPLPQNSILPGKHLTAATYPTDGLSISVEIHHNLFNDGYPYSMTYHDLSRPPLSFALADTTAYTLGYEDMLWHLCRHSIFLFQPLRLMWVIDIVHFAEKFAAEIDWQGMAKHYPFILAVLTQLHHVCPLSDALQQQADLKIGAIPSGVGQEFQGWPRYALGQQQNKSTSQILRDTLYPSEWWLRLNYGLRKPASLIWYRWIGHPLGILAWFVHHSLTHLNTKQ